MKVRYPDRDVLRAQISDAAVKNPDTRMPPFGRNRILTEAEIDLSVGTVGDAYDNALAECVIGLFKTEVINRIGPWKSMREVEWETLKWPYGDASIAYRLTGRLV